MESVLRRSYPEQNWRTKDAAHSTIKHDRYKRCLWLIMVLTLNRWVFFFFLFLSQIFVLLIVGRGYYGSNSKLLGV
ncbi:hypothetical protein HanRHA438_Chr03g0140651 [Helianthus annuus]|nr:hypothetical protein HanRHA438_Chr03g0140651 [Helianthus annuus]